MDLDNVQRHALPFHDMANRTDTEAIVAGNLRNLRAKRGWRQEDMSRRLGEVGYPMSVQVLSKTEKLQRSITANDLAAFARVFAVPLERLTTPSSDPDSVERIRFMLAEFVEASDEAEHWNTELEAVQMQVSHSQRKLDRAAAFLAERIRIELDIKDAGKLTRAEIRAVQDWAVNNFSAFEAEGVCIAAGVPIPSRTEGKR